MRGCDRLNGAREAKATQPFDWIQSQPFPYNNPYRSKGGGGHTSHHVTDHGPTLFSLYFHPRSSLGEYPSCHSHPPMITIYTGKGNVGDMTIHAGALSFVIRSSYIC